MSYQEKLICGQFLTLVLVCSYLFGVLRIGVTLWMMLGAIILMIVLQIVYAILVAMFSKKEDRDERDRLIEYKAYKVSYLTLMVLGGLWVWALMSHIFTVGQLTSPGLILAVWFGVEGVRTGTQLVLHRIGVSA
jgi:hypothetical protein